MSNNTNKTISIINYRLLQVAKAFPAIDYTGMNQEIYEENSNGEIHNLRFPVIINPGTTINLILKIGIQLEPDAYKLVKDKIEEEPKISFGSMEKFLWSNGMDFYGNKVTALQYGIEYDLTSYQFTSLDKVQEQIFNVNFKTSQGVNISENISIYSFLDNEFSGRSC